MSSDLSKRDAEIEQLKQVAKDLKRERKQLIGELKTNYPQLAEKAFEGDSIEDFSKAINMLLEYLNNMKEIDHNNAERINYAIEQVKEYVK